MDAIVQLDAAVGLGAANFDSAESRFYATIR